MHTPQPISNREGERLAIGLGLFSIALGLAEFVAPRSVTRLIGIRDEPDTESLMRIMGAREIGTGVGILSQPDRAQWLWTRVGGDALDLSLLGAAYGAEQADVRRISAATAAVAGVTMLDIIAAQRLSCSGSGMRRRHSRGIHVEEVQTVNRSIEEVYRFWRDFENFPRFMKHLESVEVIDDRRSRWRATAPAGTTVSWEAEIVEEREDELIAWRSLPGASVENRGTVRFERAPGARGTEVRVQLDYRPPAGELGRAVAWLFGEEPRQQIHEDLRRFKQLLEAGEVAISDGMGLWRAAQPAATAEQARTLAGVER